MVDSTRKRARVEEDSSDGDGGGGGGGDDRISGLCDEILHHIFSFLPTTTREVVQTCVLSKRWRNLWCSFPWLDFDEDAFVSKYFGSNPRKLPPAAGSFAKFVNNVMLLRYGSNIQKLCLSCSSSDSNRVFEYIVAAIRHNLQVLDLKILNHHHQHPDPAAENVLLLLPSSLFTCESLTCLKLNNVVLPSSSSFCLSSLKTLHLISVKFPNSNQLSTTEESLFSNSPILETLTMHNCNFEHVGDFDITALQLKYLIIIQDEEAPPPSSTSNIPSQTPFTGISAPNLTSLKLHVDMQSRWYVLYNHTNSLVEADIHLKNPSSNYISSIFMVGIFCELQNAKAITLSGSCLEVIGKELLFSPVETIKSQLDNGLRSRFMKSKESPFHNLKLMKLTTWFKDGEIHAITDLLKRSPKIETLVLEYNLVSSYEENKLPLREEKLPSECTLHHLKTIRMRGFAGRKNEVKLLTFLLENAKSLKKMIVEEASI